jgi:ketosteroid isomerase-like protein
MKRFLLMTGCVALAFVFNSCDNEASKTTETSSFSLDSVKAAIAASNAAFSASFSKGDSAAFVNCYTSDACINVTGMPRICGTPAIRSFFSGGYQMGMRGVALTTEEVMGGKDGVIETGKYEMFLANNVSVEKGKYVVMWKEENGKWKMHRDIWNADSPPSAAAPAEQKK